jgi:small subunit ribosomal protein S6
VSRLYEALFLVDSSRASAQPEQTLTAVREMLERRNVEVLGVEKWDDRKLAYEIEGHKRGTYYLTYFRSDGATNRELERDCQLSENVLRVLILRADHMSAEDLARATGQELPAAEEPKAERAPKAEPAKAPAAPKAGPAEPKPAEATPAEAKPAEAKPAEPKPAEAQPVEAAQPAPTAEPAEAQPADAVQPAAAAEPAETKPAEAAAPEPQPEPKSEVENA